MSIRKYYVFMLFTEVLHYHRIIRTTESSNVSPTNAVIVRSFDCGERLVGKTDDINTKQRSIYLGNGWRCPITHRIMRRYSLRVSGLVWTTMGFRCCCYLNVYVNDRRVNTSITPSNTFTVFFFQLVVWEIEFFPNLIHATSTGVGVSFKYPSENIVWSDGLVLGSVVIFVESALDG